MIYTTKLTLDSDRLAYLPPILPAQAKKRNFYFRPMGYAIFRNGLLMTPEIDYTINPANGFVLPLWEIIEEDTVSAMVDAED